MVLVAAMAAASVNSNDSIVARNSGATYNVYIYIHVNLTNEYIDKHTAVCLFPENYFRGCHA